MTGEERRRKQGWCGYTAKQLRKSATRSEIIFRSKLAELRLDHRFQKYFIGEERIYIADFFLSKKKIVIEIDGDYHFKSSQIKKDAMKDQFYFNDHRVKGVLRMTNEQAETISCNDLKRIIQGIGHKEILSLI